MTLANSDSRNSLSKTVRASSDDWGEGLSACSRQELAVLNQVLMAVIHAESYDAFLTDVLIALGHRFTVFGAALYWTPDKDHNLRLIHGVGDYQSSLPDIIPEGSDLLKEIFLRRSADTCVSPSQQDQPRLFQDDRMALFSPIFVRERLLGALAVVHHPDEVELLRLILDEAARAIELHFNAPGANCFSPINALLAPTPPDRNAPQMVGGESIRLTLREKEALDLLALGMSNKEMADRLFISVATCKRHVEHVLAKLNVHSRAAAVAIALGLKPEASTQP